MQNGSKNKRLLQLQNYKLLLLGRDKASDRNSETEVQTIKNFRAKLSLFLRSFSNIKAIE